MCIRDSIVHYRDLAGWSAEADEAQFQPEAHGFEEGWGTGGSGQDSIQQFALIEKFLEDLEAGNRVFEFQQLLLGQVLYW